ncbi:CTP:molybdopterin cytidylyltransferase MocA [Sedimentibacter acidaminivorans]|uniref:CTP:molybdopterin cytidylyltransferase MocA n=1 Tax=Sedimentibacter acidaminivorans TaxID=913099 RepID=A0ABS4GIE1_9FIRM|nr:CTP:molybdopterin cytidylyltransferase MocA [Sedimentibacter acidaminivorans]
MKKNKIGVVIVAGGLSSRMKAFKPLLTIGNKTMIETTIENYMFLGATEIVVVTGYRENDIKEKLKNYKISFVKNENYESTQMFDSVCIGLGNLKEKVDMVFISPSDSPFVQNFTLKSMIKEMEITDELSFNIIQPNYAGKKGHPILLRQEAISGILGYDGTMGLQGAIAKMNSSCKNIAFVDPGIIMDADIKNDFLKLIEYNENKNCPSYELCEEIQNYFQLPEEVKLHSNKVLEVAVNFCDSLYEKGILLNRKNVIAASLLHDIAKGMTKHADVGAKWLLDMGYEEVSKIVAEHMELNTISEVPTEKEVVYLADKLVKANNVVTIQQRFAYKEELYKNNKTAMEAIKKRKAQALYISNMIFELCKVNKFNVDNSIEINLNLIS